MREVINTYYRPVPVFTKHGEFIYNQHLIHVLVKDSALDKYVVYAGLVTEISCNTNFSTQEKELIHNRIMLSGNKLSYGEAKRCFGIPEDKYIK